MKQTNKQKVTEIIKKKTIGTKLITNIKKLKLKIQSRAWNFKNTMLKKRRKKQKQKQTNKKKTRSKNYKIYICEVC